MSESNKIEEYEAETEELNKETKQNYILLGAAVAGAFLFDMKKRNRKLY